MTVILQQLFRFDIEQTHIYIVLPNHQEIYIFRSEYAEILDFFNNIVNNGGYKKIEIGYLQLFYSGSENRKVGVKYYDYECCVGMSDDIRLEVLSLNIQMHDHISHLLQLVRNRT
jgi:hypothetical protein